MDWEDLRFLAAFAACGSLSSAARHLGVEHATVGRRIAMLEDGLGLKLVDRRGRRLTLTSDGDRVAAIADRMDRETLAIQRLADGARSELKGQVTISAPSAYAAILLAKPLVALRRRHPDLAIRLLGEARTASLERREADIAIRLSRPETGDLTAVKLGDMPFRLYGETAYLATTPQEDWSFIGSDGAMAGSPQQRAVAAMASANAMGFWSDHAEIQLALVEAGGGVAMLPDIMAASRPGIVPARPDDPPLMRESWLVVHSDMANAAPIRAVVSAIRGASVAQDTARARSIVSLA